MAKSPRWHIPFPIPIYAAVEVFRFAPGSGGLYDVLFNILSVWFLSTFGATFLYFCCSIHCGMCLAAGSSAKDRLQPGQVTLELRAATGFGFAAAVFETLDGGCCNESADLCVACCSGVRKVMSMKSIAVCI